MKTEQVGIGVQCSVCGSDLAVFSARVDRFGTIIIEVEPCGSCLSDARIEELEAA